MVAFGFVIGILYLILYLPYKYARDDGGASAFDGVKFVIMVIGVSIGGCFLLVLPLLISDGTLWFDILWGAIVIGALLYVCIKGMIESYESEQRRKGCNAILKSIKDDSFTEEEIQEEMKKHPQESRESAISTLRYRKASEIHVNSYPEIFGDQKNKK